MNSHRILRYIGWAVAGAMFAGVLYILAGLGSIWVPVGVVAFVALIAVVNRLTRKPTPRTGQPTPQHRVVSTDQDRWGGGGASL